MVGSERHVCNAIERIIAVQGQFRVIQGRWFWYQSKARMIYYWWSIATLVLSCTVSEIRRFIGRKIAKIASSIVPTPVSVIALARGWPRSNFVMNHIFIETRMFRLSDGEEIMTFWRNLRFDTIPECDGQTDGRTDGQTDIPPLAIPAVCIARYANALVKT